MAIASIVLNEFGVGLGYVYNFMATALGSAVVPIACSIYTNKLDKVFAITAAIAGGIIAVASWLIYAASLATCPAASATDPCYDTYFDKTGTLEAQLTGGCVALGASGLICAIGCFVKPMNFDWNILQQVELVGGDGGENSKVLGDEEDVDGTPEALLAAQKWILKYAWGLTLFLVVVWPAFFIPMGMFGKSTFQLWAGVALMWGWIGTIVIVFLPVYESLDGILGIFVTLGCWKPKEGRAKTTGEADGKVADI